MLSNNSYHPHKKTFHLLITDGTVQATTKHKMSLDGQCKLSHTIIGSYIFFKIKPKNDFNQIIIMKLSAFANSSQDYKDWLFDEANVSKTLVK